MQIKEALRLRILELCEKNNMTPGKLCSVCGLNWSTLENIISGRNNSTTISTIKKICDGLGINLSEFFASEIFLDLE
ncbi:MAG: helix-turn-helix transcriptional regulator [Oscillospiraceae bacterium]|nr:helix-turn-helix transcriptional regulator [Oscillospiraceae bacterium]